MDKLMSFCYKKLWKLLIDRDMTRADLRKATGISTATLAKLSKGEDVKTSILLRICNALKCDAGDIMEFQPDDATAKEADAK